jgi:hypothetical protein
MTQVLIQFIIGASIVLLYWYAIKASDTGQGEFAV